MVTSHSRTIMWRPRRHLQNPPMVAPLLRWPTAQPDDYLDYSLDLTKWLEETSDTISSAAWSARPSGAGELQIPQVTVNAGIVTGWLTGGVAGRGYLIKCEITTAGGRTLELIPHLQIDFLLAVFPLSKPPSVNFGNPTTSQTSGFDFSNPDNSSLIPTL